MRVFVVGATGVLGRALLPQLMAAGHTAIGLARSPEKAVAVEKQGGQAVRGDVLDAGALRRLLRETQPDAIVNLATATPLKLRINPKDWEMNDRVRVEGTTNLLAAAQEARIQIFVQESVGYVCQSRGTEWIGEDAPRSRHPFLRATLQMEDIARAGSVPTTLLRFAALVTADAWHTQQSIAALRRGMLPLIGDGSAYASQVHAEDAAQAILCTLADPQAAAGQTFHVVGDAPAPMREVFPYIARLLHAPAPRHVAPFLAKMAVGAVTIEILTASYRMSNLKIKQRLGFAPRYPSYQQSWAQVVAEVGERDFTPADDLKF
jgi:nucleoside-diphosphate-sugar epimerase